MKKISITLLGAVIYLSLMTIQVFGDIDWTPIFEGIDYQLIEKNTKNGLVRIHVARIDSKNPSVSFLVTPGEDPLSHNSNFPAKYTTSFLEENGLQLAINGAGYTPSDNQQEGMPKQSETLVISNSITYSNHRGKSDAYFVVLKNGQLAIMDDQELKNAQDTDSINMALGGWIQKGNTALIVSEGQVKIHINKEIVARTAIGISEDNNTLYFVVVDGGPKKGFFFKDKISLGTTMEELAEIMVDIGAYRAMNLDGSGSSAMVLEDPDNHKAVLLNLPSDYKKEGQRAIATHVGVRSARLSITGGGGSKNTTTVLEQAAQLHHLRDQLKKGGLANPLLYVDITPSTITTSHFADLKYLLESMKAGNKARFNEFRTYFENDINNDLLDINELKSVSEKISGVSQGGVYRGADELVWFIKTGQHPWIEYLSSRIMNLILGTESTPLVKVVIGAKDTLTASRMVRGLDQLKKLEINEQETLPKRAELDTVMDFLGVLDRHDRNMGYVELDQNQKMAARVDFDHSFKWGSNMKEGPGTSPLNPILFERSIEKYISSEADIAEMLSTMQAILAIPENTLRFAFYRGLLVLDAVDPNLDFIKYDNILEALITRRSLLKDVYAALIDIDLFLKNFDSTLKARAESSLASLNMGVSLDSLLMKKIAEKKDIDLLEKAISKGFLGLPEIERFIEEMVENIIRNNDENTFLEQIIARRIHEKLGNPFNKGLRTAAMSNSIKIAKLLIDNGADVNWLDAYGYSPLEWALLAGDSEMSKLLEEKGAALVKKLKILGVWLRETATVSSPGVEELHINGGIFGTLDLTQATNLKKLETSWEIHTKGSVIGVPASVEDVKIGDLFGTLDLSQATSLKKLETGQIYEGATLKLTPGVEEVKVKDLQRGQLDLTQATNLKTLEIGGITRSLAPGGAIVGLTSAIHLKKLKTGPIFYGTTVTVPVGVEEVCTSAIIGTLDLSQAVNLSEEVVAALEARVEKGAGKIIRPIRFN